MQSFKIPMMMKAVRPGHGGWLCGRELSLKVRADLALLQRGRQCGAFSRLSASHCTVSPTVSFCRRGGERCIGCSLLGSTVATPRLNFQIEANLDSRWWGSCYAAMASNRQ